MTHTYRFLRIILLTLLLALFGWWIVSSTFLSDNTPLVEKQASDIRIATYNVHYISARQETGPWSIADWERRRTPLAEAVRALDADIIGFQEMETFGGSSVSATNLTLEWLLASQATYTAGAVGDPNVFPSTQPIFFRSDRFTLRDQGWFFFSPTPDILYARTYNGSYPAFAAWVELTDTTSGETFKVVNIHTDFQSYSNRRQSLELTRDRVTPWLEAGETVFVIGDFNAWRGSKLHTILEQAGFTFAPVTPATYHFNRGIHLFPAIDHISYTENVTHTAPPVVVQKRFVGEWPTDHYPVAVDVRIVTKN